MKTKSKKIIKLATFSDFKRPIQKTELKKTIKKNKNLIFYKKPKDIEHYLYIKDEDKNGKKIWIDGDAWLSPIDIKKPEDTKLLPEEIQKFIPKWEQKIERLIKEHKFKPLYIDYRYADPDIQFIYENKVYCIHPQAFKNIQRKNVFYIPRSVSSIIIKDLESTGCFYSYVREHEIV